MQTHPLCSAGVCKNQRQRVKSAADTDMTSSISVHSGLVLVARGQIFRLILSIAFHCYCAGKVSVRRRGRRRNICRFAKAAFFFLGVTCSCSRERDIGLLLLRDLLQWVSGCTSFKTEFFKVTQCKLGCQKTCLKLFILILSIFSVPTKNVPQMSGFSLLHPAIFSLIRKELPKEF